MLALDPDSLRGLATLDVASCPGSFVAESLGVGLHVTACDPLYGSEPETITAHGKADIDACRGQIRRTPSTLAIPLCWIFTCDPSRNWPKSPEENYGYWVCTLGNSRQRVTCTADP
jgi:hypothetical protein